MTLDEIERLDELKGVEVLFKQSDGQTHRGKVAEVWEIEEGDFNVPPDEMVPTHIYGRWVIDETRQGVFVWDGMEIYVEDGKKWPTD